MNKFIYFCIANKFNTTVRSSDCNHMSYIPHRFTVEVVKLFSLSSNRKPLTCANKAPATTVNFVDYPGNDLFYPKFQIQAF